MIETLFLDRLSDEELAGKAQAGSHSYFEELVSRYCQRLFYFLRPRVGTNQDTEDLVQETFLKLYCNLHRFDSTFKFSTWLYTVANRLVISFYRKNRSWKSRFVSPTTEMNPQETMLRDEDSLNLWNFAKRLPPNQFQSLWLRYVEDMPIPEIAAILKKSQVHVRVLLHRARLKLAKELNPASKAEEIEKPSTVEKAPAGKSFSFF